MGNTCCLDRVESVSPVALIEKPAADSRGSDDSLSDFFLNFEQEETRRLKFFLSEFSGGLENSVDSALDNNSVSTAASTFIVLLNAFLEISCARQCHHYGKTTKADGCVIKSRVAHFVPRIVGPCVFKNSGASRNNFYLLSLQAPVCKRLYLVSAIPLEDLEQLSEVAELINLLENRRLGVFSCPKNGSFLLPRTCVIQIKERRKFSLAPINTASGDNFTVIHRFPAISDAINSIAGSFRMMFAEDDLLIRKCYENMMKRFFNFFSDAMECWSVVQNPIQFEQQALIVSDMNMPKMCGDELIQKMRQAHRNVVHKPLIFVVSGETPVLIPGSDGFISKPLSVFDLDCLILKAIVLFRYRETYRML